MKDKNKSNFLEGYENKWVALNNEENRVIASADSLEQAYNKAIESGEKNPVMFKVPSRSGGYILCNSLINGGGPVTPTKNILIPFF